ncbi:MAG: 16S rRNA (guanine(966)-N(2))-methyltransferase RsmD [Crocinitomicaceae bacterium]|nr:16S rRNA (guanine(966)-N(2))-methyltransferase RsmD [Crocinitomicaceae bacterium]
MRIIGGKYKSHFIPINKKIKARPTTNMAKEALFNILDNKISLNNINVLDIFCGTGNISYEFASRGAGKITSVDNQINAINFVKKQKNHWGMNIIPIKKNALSFLEFTKDKYDVIFADPPYDFNRLEDIPKIVFERNLLSSNGLLILEHSSQKNFEKSANFMEQRTYSSVNFSFFYA